MPEDQLPIFIVWTARLALAFLMLGGAACAVFWLIAAERILRTAATTPSGAQGLRLAAETLKTEDLPPMLMVVPAHNEAAIIAKLIRSLRAQDYPSLHIVLALDRCTDDTEGAARRAIGSDPRFTIHTIDHCPDGWAGKVHAIHSALKVSAVNQSPETLLCFTDADCSFHPAGLRAAVALLRDRRLDMLSLLSRLETHAWFEWLAQPAAVFELVRQYPLRRVNRHDERQRAFANGQFMLFTANAHTAIGGHEAVRDELLEDIALARLLKQHGLRAGLLAAGPVLQCRMYDSWTRFKNGWKRIYTESAARKAKRLRRSALKLLTIGSILPAAAVLAAAAAFPLGAIADWPHANTVTLSIGAAGLAATLLGLNFFVLTAGLPLITAPLFPFGALAVARLLHSAARDLETGAPTEWGGRAYKRENRSETTTPEEAATEESTP